MSFALKQIKREFDTKPIAAHIYVTDQCNLDCSYCTEYDNSVPHPPLNDLKLWIAKIRELGCIRIGLQGGEPLLHPDIVEIVRFSKELGFRTTMATNGFRLTEELIEALHDAGLDTLNLSIDRITPIDSTRKSLKTVLPKIELLKRSRLKFKISGVLFHESVDEARELIDYGVGEKIPVHVRIVHSSPDGEFAVGRGSTKALEDVLDYQLDLKRRGKKITSTVPLIEYQRNLLHQKTQEWTCVAGFKYFFVSAKGKFWLCSTRRVPGIDIMSVTPEMLRSYFHKKECQSTCGVYCVVSESLAFQNPARFVLAEGRQRLQGLLSTSPTPAPAEL